MLKERENRGNNNLLDVREVETSALVIIHIKEVVNLDQVSDELHR